MRSFLYVKLLLKTTVCPRSETKNLKANRTFCSHTNFYCWSVESGLNVKISVTVRLGDVDTPTRTGVNLSGSFGWPSEQARLSYGRRRIDSRIDSVSTTTTTTMCFRLHLSDSIFFRCPHCWIMHVSITSVTVPPITNQKDAEISW